MDFDFSNSGKKHITYKDIACGKIFKAGNSYYMKVNSFHQRLPNGDMMIYFNAVNAKSGNFSYFDDFAEVVRVNGKFKVESEVSCI